MAKKDQDRAAALAIGVLLFATYAYFISPPSWNENSRFDLARSLVERRSLDIDPYHHNTGDKSFYEGRHFSDKAPGTSLLAAPAYAIYSAYLKVTGGAPPASVSAPPRDGDELSYLVNPSFRKALYLCNLSTNAAAGAVLGAVFFLVLRRRFALPPRHALGATIVLGWGSLVFPYATMFYGHVLAATCLFGSFAALTARAPGARASLLAAGLLSGLAVLVELPTAAAVAGLGAYAVLRFRRRSAWFLAGLVAPVALLFAYQQAAFGHPLRAGYALVSRAEFAQGMSRGLFGINLPRVSVFAAILAGRSRGLLYVSPILLVAFIGLGRWLASCLRRREDRALAALASGIVLFFLLMNAGYYRWHGGAALGPRHVIPALPFLCLGLAFVPVRVPRRFPALSPGLLGVLAGISVLNQVAATAVGPAAPIVPDVLRDHVYDHLLRGEVAVAPGAGNLGLLLGLPGVTSLVPLLVAWALGLRLLFALVPAGGEPVGARPHAA